MNPEQINIALSLLAPVGIGGLFLYVRGIKADVGEVAKDLKEFKNGHYTTHIEDAYNKGMMEGSTKRTLSALHKRIDKMEKNG